MEDSGSRPAPIPGCGRGGEGSSLLGARGDTAWPIYRGRDEAEWVMAMARGINYCNSATANPVYGRKYLLNRTMTKPGLSLGSFLLRN